MTSELQRDIELPPLRPFDTYECDGYPEKVYNDDGLYVTVEEVEARERIMLARIAELEAKLDAALQAVDDLRAERAEVAELEKAVDVWRRNCEAARAEVADARKAMAEVQAERDKYVELHRAKSAGVSRLGKELRAALATNRRLSEEKRKALKKLAEAELLAHKLGIATDVLSRGPDTSSMTVTHNVMPDFDAARNR